MKLSFLFLIIPLIQVTASTKAQTITLNKQNTSITSIFEEIMTQIDYDFSYSEQQISKVGPISISVTKASITEVLDKCFENQALTYSISNKTITIKEKQPSLLNRVLTSFGADVIISGIVSDEKGNFLSGATVKLKGSKTTTRTDDKGFFSINSEEESGVLNISYLGYVTEQVSFSANNLGPFKVLLKQETSELEEIEINAGYYKVTDREKTGSIARITKETIGKQPVNNFLQAMQGRIPGVEIVQQTGLPGGAIQVRIRGQNSILNGNDPLYIVNGIPFLSVVPASSNSTLVLPNPSPLSSLNPADIESIEVLKDADATAIYGSRGANGVILITTKEGRSGNLNIDFNINQGVGRASRKVDLLNTEQYLEMRDEALSNENRVPGESDYDVNGTWDNNRYTDWQKELIGGNATTTNGQLSISGGSINTNFLLSGSYYRETNVFPGNKAYQKKSSNLNLNHSTPDQKLKLSLFGNYNFETNNLPTIDLTQYITLAPNAPPLLKPSGALNWDDGLGSLIDNPLSFLFTDYNTSSNLLSLNGNISYSIFSNLKLSVLAGYSRFQKNELTRVPLTALSTNYNLTANDRSAEYGDNLNQILNIEPSIAYQIAFKQSTLDFLAGATIQNNERQNQYIRGTGYVSDNLMENVFSATTVNVRSSSSGTYRYLSGYGRVNYKFKDKYILNLTGRRDGSSRFGPNRLYADFGAVGAAWIFTDEKFIKDNLKSLDFGKLRASYGTSGNDQIGDYRYLDLWQQQSNPYQNQAAFSPSRLFNPDYAWEVNKKAEVSLELSFIKNKIKLNSTYFNNRSTNQLVEYALAPSTGFSGVTANLPATVQNTGWEFELGLRPIENKKVRWFINANLSIPKNKLVEFSNFENSSYYNTWVLGQPLNIVRTVEYNGVDGNTGLYSFKDINGNGFIDPGDRNSYKVLGQKYSGGLGNLVTFGNFELDFLIQFVKQTGRNYMSASTAPGRNKNQPTVVLDRWRNPGDATTIQKFGISTTTTPYFNAINYGDLGISDASFIRLKNISLSYRFSPEMSRKLHISNLNIFLKSQNLFTITNYIGLDPESQRFNSLPTLRVIMAGLQLSF